MTRRNRRALSNREHIVNCVINSVLKTNKLGICTLNSQSIAKKMDEFRLTFHNSKATIITVTETWASASVTDSQMSLVGYNLIRHDRKGRRGGGLAVYIKNGIKYRVLEKSPVEVKTEFIIFEICLSNVKILLVSMYNPPNVDCLPVLDEKLTNSFYLYDDIVITGDLNIDFLAQNPRSRKRTDDLKSILSTFGLTNFVSSATHFSNNSSTSLDYIIGSRPERLLSISQIDLIEFSKHDLVFCSLDYDLVFSEPVSHKVRNYSSFSIPNLQNVILSLDWSNYFCLTDPDTIVDFLYNNLKIIQDNIFPEKEFKPKLKNDNEWYSEHIKKAMIDRDLAYKKWKNTRNPEDLLSFRILRNHTRTLIRDAKQRHLVIYLDPKLPNKTLWNRLNIVGIGKNSDSSIYHSSDDINSFFVNSIPNVSANLSSIETVRRSFEFSFQIIEDEAVAMAISQIKSNSMGSDEFPLQFIKIIASFLLPQITHLFNFIFLTNKFPHRWKLSKVFPLVKKAGCTELSNLRPISILPCLSKAFEIIVKNQIMTYINSNNLLTSLQSGYRSNHSTTSAVLKVTNDISAKLDSKKIGILVLLDFSKAFDLLNHKMLCIKLEKYFAFSSSSISLINSYLTQRSQYVAINNNVSEPMSLLHGVPQGSILGPLLFTLFINDISNCIKFSKFHMYADDLQIYNFSDRCDNTRLLGEINSDLSSVLHWSKENGMLLNAKKSFALPLNRGAPLNLGQLFLGTETISYVDKTKNLGFIFDYKMSWDHHVAHMCSCIRNALRNLRPSYCLASSLKLKLFKSLVLPFFNYGDVILLMISERSRIELKKSLNMCIRFVFNLGPYDRVSHLQKEMLGCSFDFYYEYRSNIFMYKLIKNQSPTYLFENLVSGQRNLRFIPHQNRTSFYNKSFFVRGISIWNSLPLRIRESRSLSIFCKELKVYYNSE